jgi:transposase
MSTIPKFTDWREARRFRALELSKKGWSPTNIAKALGVTISAVCQWLKKAKIQGEKALHSKKIPGRPPRLDAAQCAELLDLLKRGAEAHGYQGNVWTSPRVADLIRRHFGISLGERQVRRLLHHLKWTPQTPQLRAEQRDEAAIERWAHERWPELKKKAEEESRTILFVDETGVYLLPGVVKTWAPQGETPVLYHHLTNDHLSVISAVSPEGELYFQIQREAYDSEAVIAFLKALHQTIPGKLLVIWDGAPIHRSDAIKQFLTEGATAWLLLEPLPGYAPELNPDEGIWQYLKYVELRNVCSSTIAMLETVVTTALEHIRQMTNIVKATFKEAGLG